MHCFASIVFALNLQALLFCIQIFNLHCMEDITETKANHITTKPNQADWQSRNCKGQQIRLTVMQPQSWWVTTVNRVCSFFVAELLMLGGHYQRQATEPILLHHKFPMLGIYDSTCIQVCSLQMQKHCCSWVHFLFTFKMLFYTPGCHNFFAFLKCIFLGSRLRCQLQ